MNLMMPTKLLAKNAFVALKSANASLVSCISRLIWPSYILLGKIIKNPLISSLRFAFDTANWAGTILTPCLSKDMPFAKGNSKIITI